MWLGFIGGLGYGNKAGAAQKQIEEYWLKPCLELLQGENSEPEPDDVRKVKLICEQVEKGELEIVVVLKKFAMQRSFQKQLF